MSGRRAKATPVDRPRLVAFEVMHAVSQRQSYANLLLPKRLSAEGVTGRDAAFATELTYGTLRWQGTYDAVIDACLDSSRRSIDVLVRDLLRLGAHQVLSMSVPRHAAVSTTVELAKTRGARSASGLVNAVLRRMSESPLDVWLERLTAGLAPESAEALSLRHSHPAWLVTALGRALSSCGRSPTELVDLLTADNIPAPVTLVARPGRSTVHELLTGSTVPGAWSPFAVTLASGDPGKVPAVRERRAGVQDEGSQLVALAMTKAPVESPARPERWLDMCAGPGGKAALLAALADDVGAQLEAWELREHRARLVQQQVGPDVSVRVVDAAAPDVVERAAGTFDRVLLDAPCSGAGALRRRPDARWRRSAADIPALVQTQHRLLDAAVQLTRPGGVIAYVTCSPLVDETTDVVDTITDSVGGRLRVLDARPLMPAGMPDTGADGRVQLWPHLHGTDAMFLAVLQRVG